MVYDLNPPLAVPASQPPRREHQRAEYAYHREVIGEERRPATATGKWADVWARVDAQPA